MVKSKVIVAQNINITVSELQTKVNYILNVVVYEFGKLYDINMKDKELLVDKIVKYSGPDTATVELSASFQ